MELELARPQGRACPEERGSEGSLTDPRDYRRAAAKPRGAEYPDRLLARPTGGRSRGAPPTRDPWRLSRGSRSRLRTLGRGESGPYSPGRSRPAFSLIEVLIAAALLLIIALGVLPLFTQAMVSNTAGNESTQVSNFARSRLEEYQQLPLNGASLTVPIGSTELTVEDYYSFADEAWKSGPEPAGDPARWSRTTVVRQYGVSALDDGILTPDEALDGGTEESFVHFKEVEVTVRGGRAGGVLGPSKAIILRLLKYK